MIEQWQIDQFHEQGFLVVEGVLAADEVAALQQDFDQWVNDSRSQHQAWGQTQDGRPRLTLKATIGLITLRCAA